MRQPSQKGLGCVVLLPIFLAFTWGLVALVDRLIVIFAYGSAAFFVHGLRISDSKHGILSDGRELSIRWEAMRLLMLLLPLWAFFALLTKSRLFSEKKKQSGKPGAPDMPNV